MEDNKDVYNIINHVNEILEDPYGVKISKFNNFIHLSSDNEIYIKDNCFNKNIDGLIIDKNKNSIACFPLCKDFLYKDSKNSMIDYQDAYLKKELHGVVAMFWFDEYESLWRLSTLKNFDAKDHKLDIIISESFTNIADVFLYHFIDLDIEYNYFDKDLTHIFEITSPYIISPKVRYEHNKVHYLASINNETGEKKIMDSYNNNGVKVFSLKDAIEKIEGNTNYTIVDKNNSKIFIENNRYNYDNLKNLLAIEDVIEMLFFNNHKKYLDKYPEFSEDFSTIQEKIRKLVELLINEFRDYVDARDNMIGEGIDISIYTLPKLIIENQYENSIDYLKVVSFLGAMDFKILKTYILNI